MRFLRAILKAWLVPSTSTCRRMPKKLYGKANPKTRNDQSSGRDDGQTSIWVTLIANVPEEALHKMLSAALADPLAPPGIREAEALHVSVAASLIEYAAERGADCDELWLELITEVVSDLGLSLADEECAGEEGEDEKDAERMGAVAFLGCLKRHGVLTAEPPQLPPLTAGAAVLAVLDEDGMWHDAVVETKSGGAGGPPRVLVRFVEWSKVQEMARVDVVSLAAVIDDDDANEARDGDCELCGRCLELTFHHLIPKETHARYLGKGLPRGVAEASVARGMDNPQPTREFLHSYGVMLCRYCHSAVHRFAPNAVLAQRFSTLEGLASAPEIARFVAFAAKQKVTSRK